MNWAQCIDPEWVQRRMPERFTAVIAPREPQRTVAPRARTVHETAEPNERGLGVGVRILRAMYASDIPLQAADIAEIDGALTSTQVATNVPWLLKGGDLKRTGKRGLFAYRLTTRGRKQVEASQKG